MPRLLGWFVLSMALPIALAGCGSGETLVPVSGRITLNGKPLAGVHVSFQPRSRVPVAASAGSASFGVTDSDGRYTLRTVTTDQPGAVPGQHEVRLSTPLPASTSDEDLASAAKDPIPADFRNGKTEFTVPKEGTDKADFALKGA